MTAPIIISILLHSSTLVIVGYYIKYKYNYTIKINIIIIIFFIFLLYISIFLTDIKQLISYKYFY